MKQYRCYFLNRQDKIADVAEFVCADDATAFAAALCRFEAQQDYPGFEIWEGRRRVQVHAPPSRRALANTENKVHDTVQLAF